MKIEINIPVSNPWKVAAVLSVGLWAFTTFWPNEPTQAYEDMHDHTEEETIGGNVDVAMIAESNQTINEERIRQAVLERREEILRYELQKLEEEALTLSTPEAIADLNTHRQILMTIVNEKQHSETMLKDSLAQLWEAQGIAFGNVSANSTIALNWPVEPNYGVSAGFDDAAYTQRFGIPHHAVDIPTEQGTVIRAPADGVISEVKDNGLGYSYVSIDHGYGIETIYGHVSGFIAQKGDRVLSGDPIAYSGGRPGSPGAGLLTTGPHLHFAVKQDGKLVDPIEFLPPLR